MADEGGIAERMAGVQGASDDGGTNAPGTPCILILEDEPVTAMLLARAVGDRGYRVAGPFHRPDQAQAALAADRPDAALLDVSLGRAENSRAVADALAAAGVPFAFVTGYGPETAPVVSAHPRALVIPKPADADTVGMLLEELLARREAEARQTGG